MGLIFSRFKKKKSTKDILEGIQKKIENIEEYKEHTEQQRKWLVGSLVVYSIALYLISAVFVYIYFLPTEPQEILLCITPFAIFPLLVYLLKRILTWYYRRKVENNEKSLKNLRSEKAKILDQVMETETYKVAKEIMELYAPDQLRQSLSIKSPGGAVTPISQMSHPRFTTPSSAITTNPDVRRRIVSPQAATPRPPGPTFAVRSHTPQIIRPGGPSMLPNTGNSNVNNLRSLPISNTPVPLATQSGYTHPMFPQRGNNDGQPPGPPMPRPVLPRERGVLDRFIEYLVGDGPANRYALVCRQCESHNGMALKEEFEYIAFRCAYCFYWNPARKQRPSAPRLEVLTPRPALHLPLQEDGDDDDEAATESSSCDEENSKEEEEKEEKNEVDVKLNSENKENKVGSQEDIVSTTSTSDELILPSESSQGVSLSSSTSVLSPESNSAATSSSTSSTPEVIDKLLED